MAFLLLLLSLPCTYTPLCITPLLIPSAKSSAHPLIKQKPKPKPKSFTSLIKHTPPSLSISPSPTKFHPIQFKYSTQHQPSPISFTHTTMPVSQPNTHLSLPLIIFLTLLTLLPALPVLPDPDPITIQTFLPSPSSPPATIPAFPEKSNFADGCPLSLPNDLFHSVKSACGSTKSKSGSTHLHRTRCCPVLAAWLYSAYSSTALGRSLRAPTQNNTTSSYDLPLLPDDSETCVDTLQKELDRKGVELIRPNGTCDLVYCYCGIRLHPLTCPEAFSVKGNGELTGDNSVRKLERDCLSNAVNGFPGLGGCSKCLNSLYLLNQDKSGNSTKSEERTSKMHNKDCELMGLTWLLAKNRSAYIHTVTAVLRAMMMSTAGTDPRSCSLNSDGMPLAVDSSEINDSSSSSNVVQSSLFLFILSLCLLYISVSVSLRQLLTTV